MMASGGEGESEDSGTEENSLLLAEEATRAYRLVGDPTTETGYVLRIRQEPGGSTTIRDVLLQAVDHDPGQELFSLGDRIVSAVRQPAVGVYDRAGQPIHDVLNSDLGWSGTELDTLTVVLVASETGAESAPALRPLVFEARRGSRDLTSSADSPSITILDRLGPSAMGSGTPIEPRVGFETVGVDSCLSTIRLVVQPGTQIRNLGSLVQVSSEIAGISPALSEAVISSVASVAGGLTPTGLRATTLTPGDVLRLRWSATPVPAGKARTFFVRATSTTESLESASETAGTQNAIVSAHRFSLAAARPNPFTSETTLDYSLGAAGPLSIKVYDVAGRLVRTLLAGTRPAGPGSIAWNGADDRGVMVNAGVYFARMESGTWSSGRKVMLLGR